MSSIAPPAPAVGSKAFRTFVRRLSVPFTRPDRALCSDRDLFCANSLFLHRAESHHSGRTDCHQRDHGCGNDFCHFNGRDRSVGWFYRWLLRDDVRAINQPGSRDSTARRCALLQHPDGDCALSLPRSAGGSVNGILITRFNVAPFIATLGTLYVARGAAQLSNDGATFPNLVGKPELGNTGFPILGAGSVLGIPIVIWIMVIFAAVAAFIAGKTPFGRQVYAVGGNERAAELSGIYVNRIKMGVYMICGLCAAMTGLVTASQLVAAHPAVGESYELNAIAAVVLGGTSLAGGRGTMWGTIVGALVIGVLTNGLVLLGVQEFWKKVITGLVIILAVVLDQLQERFQQRLALKRA
jgi:ribose/xylose/arabinose/galactoside ABC-type transport system permease subunit